MAADSVRKKEMKMGTKLLLKWSVGLYNHFFRRMGLRKTPLLPSGRKSFSAEAKN